MILNKIQNEHTQKDHQRNLTSASKFPGNLKDSSVQNEIMVVFYIFLVRSQEQISFERQTVNSKEYHMNEKVIYNLFFKVYKFPFFKIVDGAKHQVPRHR